MSKTEDEIFLNEVRRHLQMARLNREEAEGYVKMISNRKLKREAERLIEDYDTGLE